MAKEIAEEYTSSLADLTLNSKPLINMLTMLADDNIEHAESIVEAVEKHLDKVRSEFKLPVLYLIDSIVKNVGHAYTNLFTQNIVNTFCSVFEKVDEKVRAQMFKLRQTWADVFPAKKLYTLDIRVQCIDPAWPLIAPTPTPSIHVNPKFFAKPAVPVVTPKLPKVAAAPKVPVPVPVDSATLDMQTQLINKQKELLELKQKKLELELLQAKAKLEEQQKQLEKHSIQITKTPQQLLLKPEVAKQMLQGMKSDDSRPSAKVVNTVAPTSVKSSVGVVNNSSGGPRIAPVNSALLASVRPVLRDPRLLRQQPPSAAGAPAPAANPITQLTQNNTTSNNSNYETVNLVDEKQISNKITKKSLHTQNNSTINLDCVIVDSNTKSNKGGVLNRSKDPRLISNKVQGSKSKLSPNNGRSSERSPKKPSTTSRKSTKISSNNSRSSFKSPVLATDSPKSASKISDTQVTVAKSPISPSKYLKKLKDSPKSATDPKRVKSSQNKEAKIARTRDKFDDDSIAATPSIPAPPVLVPTDQQRVFKGLKSSAKVRNYMRRNRAISISPEPSQDVDLRIPPEKQARLQSDEETAKSTTIDDIPSNKDVDLRTLVVPAPINKKRSSTEKLEGSTNAKKSKSQRFDVLFGNEDVDLRQLPPVIATPIVAPSKPAVIRPPTPPPPIISTPPTERTDTSKEPANVKPEIIANTNLEAMRAKSNLDAIRTKSNLDAIRAKLANATKISALSEESRKISEDTDMRMQSTVFADLPQDALQRIIISQADEQLIRNGNLSQALVEKVLTLFETQKLQEAQRRESEEFRPDINITLQPISDDELSVDFSHSESEEDKVTRMPDVQIFKDTDERVAPPAPMISQNQSEMPQKAEQNEQDRIQQTNVDPRLQNRMGPQNLEAWQGHHRRRRPKTHWDSPPPHVGSHGHPDPWLRPPPVLNQALNQAMNQGMYGPRRPFPGFIRPPGDFGPRMDFIPQFIEGSQSPPNIGSQTTKELPMADPLVLEYIEQDTMRTINIDGKPREIRYYEETAIVIICWDDPREIFFQNGTRIITFDDKESFTLSFNDTYRDVTIGGKPHRIRLGAPTRELYIDGKWYECFFGGPGIGIEVDGQIRVVKMDGPAPHVKIGTVKRTDICAGKINLIINARQMVPVFLDAKPQKFDIEGKIHTLRFVDALRTVLINEVPFKVEFGGLPKPITVHDKKHFIRFSVLPRGIKPGYITLANMEGSRFPSPSSRVENENESIEPLNAQANEPALPMLGKRRLRQTESPDSSRNSPTMQNQSQLGSLDVLSSIMTSPLANSSNVTGYQIDNQDSQDSFPVSKSLNEIPGLEAQAVPSIPNNLNINELFQKLIASGIVTSAKEKTPPPVQEEIVHRPLIKPIMFNKPETLKLRQAPLISALYSGMQCSSCGVRFPPEHSMQYSQHLDWHFRQNRRGRNSARKALSRKWYYDVTDWKNFEEIEDIEEREKNWFESQQQQQADCAGEDGDEEIEIPSVPADVNSQSTTCEVCRDKFDQFYNEEKEEWHLRMAIRVDEKTYHPLCYDDYKASLIETTIEEPPEQKELEPEPTPEELELEIEEPKEEEDETKVKEEHKMEVEEDDDVVIQEPKIEQIEIDDRMDVDENEFKTDKEDDDIIFQSGIFIKQEPIDEFDISGIKTEVLDSEIDGIGIPMTVRVADTTHAELLSSIDGNVEQMVSGPSGISGKIKITITKPILAPKEPVPSTTIANDPEPGAMPEPTVDANEPLPPGEEPVQLNLKPALQGLTLAKQVPVLKGTELTGLCSIM